MLLLALPPASVLAQGADDSGTRLEEVLVTARKVEENLMTVPLAISAMSARPTRSSSAGSSYRATLDFPRAASSSRTELRCSADSPPPPIADVERVEVLKGPQSAYFGRSTFAGAINFVTSDPGQEFRARGVAEYSRFGSYEGVASIEGGLTETVSARFGAHAFKRGRSSYRRLENSGAVGRRAIHPQEVARIFQRVAHYLNVGVAPADRPWSEVSVGAISTRIGAAHDLAAAGIDFTSIMHSGGWKDPKMPRYYTRELAAKDSAMARMVRARRVAEPSKA